MSRAEPIQPDLLDWQPPEPVTRYDDRAIRATSLAGRMCRAVAETLRSCEMPRPEVARRMGDYLGQMVSRPMLDAYASEARERHQISVVRLIALLHVTRDRRLLNSIAEMFGWAVIDAADVPLIKVAAIRAHEGMLRRRRQELETQSRVGGRRW